MIKQYFYLFCFFMSFTQLICMDLETPTNFQYLPREIKHEVVLRTHDIPTCTSFLSTCKDLFQDLTKSNILVLRIIKDKESNLSTEQYTKALVHYNRKFSFDNNQTDEEKQVTRRIFCALLHIENKANQLSKSAILQSLNYSKSPTNKQKWLRNNMLAYRGVGINKKIDYFHKSIKEDNQLTLLILLLNRPQDALKTTYEHNASLLIESVLFGRHKCTRLLLQHSKQLLNYRDTFGNTALHYACEKNDFNTVSLLVENGCNINIQNTMGNKPHNMTNHKKIKQLLLYGKTSSKRKRSASEQENMDEPPTKRYKK